ncbi:MAG: hypothetical protein QOE11_3609 [Solirubrobacteraceae bacterium]|nr:hypothetical protein [Solirubrobacteraceae bacterium]
MGDAISRASTRAGVSFEVERLEHEDGELVVSGHWSGLRGVRFVRPTLVAGDREVLATLEHKPWAPRPDRAWTAAFPWTGEVPDPGRLLLAVAPSVTVPLGGPPAADPEPALALVALGGEELAPTRAPAPATERLPPATERMNARLLEQELEMLSRERDELRARLEEAHELARTRTAAERGRDNALAQLAEAVADREAAVRSRTRMQLGHAEAIAGQEAAAAAVQRAERDREEARSQRDEVLLAYRALQRHVQSERAESDRSEHPGELDADLEEPLGVRTMPAARTIMAELQRPAPSSKFVISQFDIWVVRVLGSVAAACFILLLLAIIRVFI